MAIDTMDKLVAALPGQHRHLFKASQTAEGAGTWHSLWRAAGNPGAGSMPPSGNGQVPTRLTAGAITLVNPSGANGLYLARRLARLSSDSRAVPFQWTESIACSLRMRTFARSLSGERTGASTYDIHERPERNPRLHDRLDPMAGRGHDRFQLLDCAR